MGELLAERLMRSAEAAFPGDNAVRVVDYGGGTGRLSRQLLDVFERAGPRGERMQLSLVEGNPAHQTLAKQELGYWIGSGRAEVIPPEALQPGQWQDQDVIIVANELLDAFAVRRLTKTAGVVEEWGVAWDKQAGKLIPCRIPFDERGLPASWQGVAASMAEGQTIEVNAEADNWLAYVDTLTKRALIVLIDYGDEESELFAPHRSAGTLMCYWRHQAHSDAFIRPGEQDITAHVNFTRVRSAAELLGWKEIGYVTQKRFLVEAGALELLMDHGLSDPFHPTVRRNRAVRQLLLSDGMSELFKVQTFQKGI